MNEFINPEELDDERLLYWAKHHAKRYRQVHSILNKVQQTHEAFLTEVMKRDLLDKFMRNMDV